MPTLHVNMALRRNQKLDQFYTLTVKIFEIHQVYICTCEVEGSTRGDSPVGTVHHGEIQENWETSGIAWAQDLEIKGQKGLNEM